MISSICARHGYMRVYNQNNTEREGKHLYCRKCYDFAFMEELKKEKIEPVGIINLNTNKDVFVCKTHGELKRLNIKIFIDENTAHAFCELCYLHVREGRNVIKMLKKRKAIPLKEFIPDGVTKTESKDAFSFYEF